MHNEDEIGNFHESVVISQDPNETDRKTQRLPKSFDYFRLKNTVRITSIWEAPKGS